MAKQIPRFRRNNNSFLFCFVIDPIKTQRKIDYNVIKLCKMNAIAAICFKKRIFELKRGKIKMKTISIRLDDAIYNELDSILEAMGQTKQTFFETYARTVINEGCIPFIIKAPTSLKKGRDNKMEAYEKLESLKKASPVDFDEEVFKDRM